MAYDQQTEQEAATALLIEEQGLMIAMIRPAAGVSDGQGGKKRVAGGPTTLAAVKRFVGGAGYQRTGFNDQTTMGEKREETVVIVGLKTDTFKEDDEFDYQGSRYRITYIHPNPAWEHKGEAVWVRNL